MMAAVGGLNSMARLPADGDSSQSRSSGSIQSTPNFPSAPAAGNTTELDGGHDEAGQTDAGTTAAVLGAHEATMGRTDDEEDGKVEGSTSLPLGGAANPTQNVALTDPQEAVANDDARKADQSVDEAAALHEAAKLPDTHGLGRAEKPLQDFTASTYSYVDGIAKTGGTAVTPPRPSVLAESKFELVGDNSETATTLADPAAETDVATVEELRGGQAPSGQGQESGGKATIPKMELAGENSETATTLADPAVETDVATVEELGGGQAPSGQGKESVGEATIPKMELAGEDSGAVTISTDPAVETDVVTAEELGGGQTLAGHGKESDGEATMPKMELVEEGSEAVISHADPAVVTDVETTQDQDHNREINGAKDSEATADPEGAFIPSDCFTGAKHGYVFKTGDKGLGLYVEGYVDRPVKGQPMPSHRPWNAGPGELAIRRGPLGPIPKPFKKVVPFRTRKEKDAAEESDMRPFMARMVAQKNSRGFQSTLLEREHVLDKHILDLLEHFSDPTFFKKKSGYNVHGEMLGKDGKMIVKVTPQKTEEEKAKLSWYRKVYEDRLGKHLPSKRLGDSIEARREAYAYSRHFTAELNDREEELNRALIKVLKGQTKLEFITEDYHYPGAYDLHGKVILEKGAPVLNDLHRTDEQTERACTYRYKAIQRYRAAHDDLLSAISKKDKALQKMLKHTDPVTLMEISGEAVSSSGIGIYRQKKRVAEGSASTTGPSPNQPMERPEQLRQKFAHSLKAEIKGKDRALLNEVAALEEDEANEMIIDFGKGAEVLPTSWRQDPETLKMMQRRRRQLIAENAADRRKVVCPWRPGGKHIAQEPWKPFTPRDHRPPVRSASEGKAETHKGGAGNTTIKQKGEGRGSGNGEQGAERRPHTAPTNRRKGFMDEISPRARRVLAAQSPGTSLHSAFSTYSTDPFPLDTKHRPTLQSASARTEYSIHGCPPSHTGLDPKTSYQGTTVQRAWAEIPSSSNLARNPRVGSSSKRPRSAAVEISRKLPNPSRRPATACGTRGAAGGNGSNGAAPENDPGCNASQLTNQREEHEADEPSRDLNVRSGPGVTVLWARLCAPSSDLIYNSSVWPKAPNASRPTRRRSKPSKKSATTTTNAPGPEAGQGQGSPAPETESSSPADTGIARGRAGDQAGPAIDGCPLEDLEDSLFASSSQRVNQRRRVFRGYADRSRRERTWDPGSTFFAEGASKHHLSRPRSCNNRKMNGGRGRGVNGAPSMGSATKKGHQRDRRRVSAVVHPVDMDWEKVDIERFDDAIKEIEAALGTRLFAVATQPEGQLDECFREAHELVASADVLLGCPENEQERSRKQLGPITIGNYVATVSRLNTLWTAACGVVEIVHMIRRRRDLLEVFCSEEGEQPVTEHASTDEKTSDDITCEEHHSVPSSQQRRLVQYEKRLELAELAIAIAESVKLWLSVIPWPVQVLYGGQFILSSLRIEEETLPWPPDPGQLPDDDGEIIGGSVGSVDGTKAGCETATTKLYTV